MSWEEWIKDKLQNFLNMPGLFLLVMECSSVVFQIFLQPGCILVSGCAVKLDASPKLWAHSFPGQWERRDDDGSLFLQQPPILTPMVSSFTEWWVRRVAFSPTHPTVWHWEQFIFNHKAKAQGLLKMQTV